MNLISEPWIPVRRANGPPFRIAPWQLTEGIGDPILAVASIRPDFDGALTQFLIGLLQTTCTPSEDQWWDWRETPPSPEVLKARFETLAHAFELEGERAFMQDFTPADLTKTWPIERLLIGSPGENAVAKGTDHFIKRDSVDSLCPCCVAAALYSLQINGPAFGAGYREGMRSGGPVTTLVIRESHGKHVSLWETCWSNVLEKSRYLRDGSPMRNADADRFPWLTATRISNAKPPAITTPENVHPDQQFWPLPQRVRLVAARSENPIECGLCGQTAQTLFRAFNVHHHGTLYQHFEQPLSPHRKSEQGLKALRTDSDGIGYRHWLGLLIGGTEGDMERRPARVIEQFRTLTREDGRLWAFGFDIVPGQANARCWYDSTMPIFGIEDDHITLLSAQLESMVKAAHYVSGLVMSAVLRASLLEAKQKEGGGSGMTVTWKWPRDLLGRLKRTPSERADAVEARVNASGEELSRRVDANLLSGPLAARRQFWTMSETAFFKRAEEMREAVRSSGDQSDVSRRWLSDMRKTSNDVFQDYGRIGDFDVDPRRIALANFELERDLNGPRLRQLLHLP